MADEIDEKKRWPSRGLSFKEGVRNGAMLRGRRELLEAREKIASKETIEPADRLELVEWMRSLQMFCSDPEIQAYDLEAIPSDESVDKAAIEAAMTKGISALEDELDQLSRLTPAAPTPEAKPPLPPKPTVLDELEGATGSKTCPDCAEEIKAAARVCRYCGHRFDGGKLGTASRALGSLSDPDAPPPPPGSAQKAYGRLSAEQKKDTRYREIKDWLKSQGANADNSVEELYRRLGEDEGLAYAAKVGITGEKGYGDLIATTHKLVFSRYRIGIVFDKRYGHEIPYEAIEWVAGSTRAFRSILRVAVKGKIWEFHSVKPKKRTQEIALFIQSKLDEQST